MKNQGFSYPLLDNPMGFLYSFLNNRGVRKSTVYYMCTILIWQRITFATYVPVNMCRSRSVTLFIHLFILCACGLVEQVCICQASVQYETDLILLWRLIHAYLYSLEGLALRVCTPLERFICVI